jgi:glycine/D-amino acid oxidase-like deaminating enzyme
MTSEAEVAVVGSGVMAWAAAWELARAGSRPIVVPTPLPLPETGHVASGPAMPYARVVRDLGHASALETWRVYREGHERLRAFLAGLQGDFSYRRPGAFLLALGRQEAALLADSEDSLREDGFAGEFLDHYMLETRLPLFGFAGGYWAEDDAHLDAGRLAEALRESAEVLGAVVADVGASVREVAVDRSVVRVAGARGQVEAERVVLADAGVLPAAGRTGMTRTSRTIEAVAHEGFEPPALARSGDGRFRWHASDGMVRFEVDAGLDVEDLLARLTLREVSVRGERAELAPGDGRPVVGPALGQERLFLACGAEPCGLALVAGRWIAEWLRTGRDPTPEPFRAARSA